MEKQVPTLEVLKGMAQKLASSLTPSDRATLITLSGELGAGKTTLSQMIGETLGVTETMISPTFVLEKVYDLDGEYGFERLVHIDAYRLKGGDELQALGFADILENKKNLVLLEWPEMVAEALPPAHVAISLKVNADGTRTYNTEYA